MPRSFVSFLVLAVCASVLTACGGPPKKPTPPEKTSDMEVAKGTTTTDLPGEEPAMPGPMDEDQPVAAGPDEVPPVAEPPVAPPRPLDHPEFIERHMTGQVPGEEVAEGPDVTPPPDGMPEAGGAAEQYLRELEARKRVEMEAKASLVDYYLSQAEKLHTELRHKEAETWVLRALDLAPDDQRAQDLHRRILAAQGVRDPQLVRVREQLEELHRVKIQEAQTKAQFYFNEGKKAFHESRWSESIENFENVLTIIDNGPYGADWGTLRAETEEFLFQARERLAAAEEAEARDAARRALLSVKEEELQRKREAEEKIHNLLTQGLKAYEDDRFEIAEQAAEQVLALDPMNARARELRDQAVRARHAKNSEELIDLQKRRFREWRLDILQARIPWSSRPLVWPSQREWDQVTRRADAVSGFAAETSLSPQEQILQNRLRETTVTFNFNNTAFPDVIDHLRITYGFNFFIDPEVQSDLEGRTVTLPLTQPMSMETALEFILQVAGPEYTYVLRGNVIVITNTENARAEPVLRVHAVGDLTINLRNFIAPDLILKPAGSEISEDAPQFGKSEEGDTILSGTIDDLVDLITTNIQPDSWSEPFTITAGGENKLVVNHTPEVQAEIAAFLDDLRRFAGLVVTVEARFLTVNDDFLQDIGVDILGLGGKKGPLVNLDDVTNGLDDMASAGFDNTGGTAPGPTAGNPSAGVFFNQGGDGDYRGRNENIFDAALGSVLSPVGGAIVQYTLLDDTNVSLILKAVEKSRHARLLQAPILTVYNTQRANLTLVNQLSFVQDFDVEVAQTAFIADPIISIIQDGLTLDVRPTISHDRKYITLELQPTIATLLRPIQTFQVSLGALSTPITLQLPETIIQKSQTTVRIPDGGSLVIGGLKNISFVDMQSEVPFLAKIPILNFFFSRKGSSREIENLMIIVTARITDLAEEESRFRAPVR